MYDLFDLVFKRWERPVLEANGYKILNTDNGCLIILNVLGIGRDDLKLEIKNGFLVIDGKTEVKEIDFINSVNYKFNVSQLRNKVDSVDYELKNGLAYISLNYKKEKEKEIKINYKG